MKKNKIKAIIMQEICKRLDDNFYAAVLLRIEKALKIPIDKKNDVEMSLFFVKNYLLETQSNQLIASALDIKNKWMMDEKITFRQIHKYLKSKEVAQSKMCRYSFFGKSKTGKPFVFKTEDPFDVELERKLSE